MCSEALVCWSISAPKIIMFLPIQIAKVANYLAARWFNFACGANYPYQILKGGYSVFVWGVLTGLDLFLP